MSVCLSVSPAIDSLLEVLVLRPVSLKPVGLEGVQVKKIFPKSDQWPSYLRKKKFFLPLMLFCRENFIFYIFFR